MRVAAQFKSDWWTVLGVAPSASKDEIVRKYRHKIKQCHPDRLGGFAPELLQLAEEQAKALNRAYANAKRTRRYAPEWCCRLRQQGAFKHAVSGARWKPGTAAHYDVASGGSALPYVAPNVSVSPLCGSEIFNLGSLYEVKRLRPARVTPDQLTTRCVLNITVLIEVGMFIVSFQ